MTRFTMDPVVANTLVALLNTLAVAACVPPIAVWYSRKIASGEPPDLLLRIRWTRAGRHPEPPWEVVAP